VFTRSPASNAACTARPAGVRARSPPLIIKRPKEEGVPVDVAIESFDEAFVDTVDTVDIDATDDMDATVLVPPGRCPPGTFPTFTLPVSRSTYTLSPAAAKECESAAT
jgi:hypothetical protein